MSYRVIRGSDERPSIALRDEPSYCRAFTSAPAEREPELSDGLWLVLVFATWSVPDVEAVRTAIDTVKHFRGLVNLGLRPFDDPSEHATWCPSLVNVDESPLWVLLRDGDVCLELRGLVAEEALVQAIESAFSLGSPAG